MKHQKPKRDWSMTVAKVLYEDGRIVAAVVREGPHSWVGLVDVCSPWQDIEEATIEMAEKYVDEFFTPREKEPKHD